MVKKHCSVKEKSVNYQKIVDQFLDELAVGVGVQYENLNLYSIYRMKTTKTDLVSLKEALKEGILEIKETGVVREILVINKSKDKKILIVEGETIKGGAQNRLINTTIIIMPNTQEKIHTTCVQQHRWNTFDAPFKSTDYIPSYIHSHFVKGIHEKLSNSYRECGGYGGGGTSNMCFSANQGGVWSGTTVLLNSAGSIDQSADIHDVYETKKDDIDKWMKKFQPVLEKPIVGVVAEIDGDIFADISDSMEFAKTILPQIVKGFCLSAMVSKSKKELSIDEDRMITALEDLGKGELIVGDSPNKVGKDIRIKTENSLSNIFCYKKEIVHWVVVKG